MYADLHIHSDFSDGIYSPDEILKRAEKAGLKKIAITDHDNFSGSLEANKILKISNLELDLVPGVEFSCTEGVDEYHIIGLFVEFDNEKIKTLISRMQKKRFASVKKIINYLQSKEINISMKDVASKSKGSIGRPHIALELVEKKYAKSVNDAFNKYLSNKILKNIKEPRMSVFEAINTIKESKGISIWAHPDILKKTFQRTISSFKKLGLCGVEIHSPRYGLNRQEELLKTCKKLDLLVSGGSDFHGLHEGIEISKTNAITQTEYESLLERKNSL